MNNFMNNYYMIYDSSVALLYQKVTENLAIKGLQVTQLLQVSLMHFSKWQDECM